MSQCIDSEYPEEERRVREAIREKPNFAANWHVLANCLWDLNERMVSKPGKEASSKDA